MELDEETIARANARANQMRAAHPAAIAAHYDRRRGQVIVQLNSRLEIAFAPSDAQGLEEATPEQLDSIEISPSGLGISFPKLDADLYLPALLEGFLGSKQWMAARMGADGGRSRSKAKTAAARANGALGGRPRKNAAKGKLPSRQASVKS